MLRPFRLPRPSTTPHCVQGSILTPQTPPARFSPYRRRSRRRLLPMDEPCYHQAQPGPDGAAPGGSIVAVGARLLGTNDAMVYALKGACHGLVALSAASRPFSVAADLGRGEAGSALRQGGR